MANRLALDIVVRYLAENDLLYVHPTDTGRSPEPRALQEALDRYYSPPRFPLPRPPTQSTAWVHGPWSVMSWGEELGNALE